MLVKNSSGEWVNLYASPGNETHPTVVEHGSDSTVSRPTAAIQVQWVGTVNPVNAKIDDQLLRTDYNATYRYDGTNWKSLNSEIENVVVDHGAVGDGTTDDTTAIQNAVDAANGVSLFFPNGTYRVTDSIRLPKNSVLNFAPGAIIDATELRDTHQRLFQVYASPKSSTSLNADAARGDISVSVASGDEAAFAPGDYVRLRSERQRESASASDAEFHRVHSVSDGSIKFMDGVLEQRGYATTDSAAVELANFVENIVISGGTFIGPANEGVTDTVNGLETTLARRILIHGTEWLNWSDTCVAPEESHSIMVANSTFRQLGDSPPLNYGVNIRNGCQHVTVTNCYFEYCRNGVTSGGASTGYGVSRYIVIDGNTFYGNRSAAIDSKSDTEMTTISDNVLSTRGDVGSTLDGINWQGISVNITGNIIQGVRRTGINVESRVFSTGHYIIKGNNISHTIDSGILVHAQNNSGADIGSLVISDNVMHDVGTGGNNGLYVIARSDGGSMRNLTVSGNTIEMGSDSIAVWIRARGSNRIGDGTITGNVIEGGGTSTGIDVRASDTSTLERILIGNNRIYQCGTGVNGHQDTDALRQNCYVIGNIAEDGITGFDTAEESSENMTA